MRQIHHILLYMCAQMPAELASQDFFECGPRSATGNMFIMKYCQTVIGVWAVGAKVPTRTGSTTFSE